MTLNQDQIIRLAKEAIELEAETLRELAQSVDYNFFRAVRCVYQSKGRLIVTGIGKSAIVGQKMVATFNSTGTPALFLHAADAIHGDLGMVQKDDVLLIISKSGNTSEIKTLIPYIQNMGNEIIAIVGGRENFLYNNASYVLLCSVMREADPNNLAPTTSTTAQMAMGDALAVALIKANDFSSGDFAIFHPGGALGKQLHLRCKDLLRSAEQPAIGMDASIPEVIIEISKKRLGATAVVDRFGKMQGIITDGDLRRMLQQHPNFTDMKAADIYSPHPICIEGECLAIDALKMMQSKNISHLIVLLEGRYIGILHLHDLIKEGLS